MSAPTRPRPETLTVLLHTRCTRLAHYATPLLQSLGSGDEAERSGFIASSAAAATNQRFTLGGVDALKELYSLEYLLVFFIFFFCSVIWNTHSRRLQGLHSEGLPERAASLRLPSPGPAGGAAAEGPCGAGGEAGGGAGGAGDGWGGRGW